MRFTLLALAALALAPASANAATYSAVGDFSLSNPSGQWSYGSGLGGTVFTAFSQSNTNCFNTTGFSCHSNGDYLGVGLNMSAGDVDPFGTVSIPNDELWVHPNDGAGATDSIVRFLVPTTSSYSISGLFQRLSKPANNGSGNGVVVSIYNGANLLFSSSALAGAPTGGSQTAFNLSEVLAGGSTLSFVVNNNGEYQFDSTGLAATIGGVPEPVSWALLVGGFGLVGATYRRRRSTVVYA